MKAMVLTGIREMELRDVPDPAVRRPSDVLVRVKSVGVCGSDIHYYTKGRIGSQVVRHPFTVGHECSGIVAAVGRAARRVSPGDRVAIDPAMFCGACDQCAKGRENTCRELRFLGCPGQAEGCLSERIVVPESSCHRIPPTLSFDQATLSEPLSIAIYAVKKAAPMERARIAILGAGPIGLSVLLAAKLAGAAKVYATDKIPERLAVARRLGAHSTANPLETDPVADIAPLEPLGLDVVFECCGDEEAVDQAVRLLGPGGRLFIIGIPDAAKLSFDVDDMRRKELRVENVRRQARCVEEALRRIERHEIEVGDLVTHRFPFERAKEAFDLVAEYRDGVVKALIEL
ncbi:MAG: zinc-dependent alcohol dehydrogenase [Planctomycetota bacterium]